MTQAEYPEWLASEKAAYVGDIVRAGALSPKEAVRKSDRDFAKLIPEGLATPDNPFLVLEAAGGQIGTGWLKHGYLPGVTYGYSVHPGAAPPQRVRSGRHGGRRTGNARSRRLGADVHRVGRQRGGNESFLVSGGCSL